MKIKRVFIYLLIFSFVTLPFFSESAKVTYIKGKVEVFRNEKWQQLKVGDFLQEKDIVSTGFQSEMKITYKDSVMKLGALTRITFEELSTSDSKETVSVFLNTGAVRSKVNHSSGKRVAYSVKTPVAVASVRGTEYMVLGSSSVFCYDGAVAVYPNFEYKNNQKKDAKKENIKKEDEDLEELEDSIQVYNSATANTSAKEIFKDAPAQTVVVGKNRNISMMKNGLPPQIMQSTLNKINKPINSISTAADEDKYSNRMESPFIKETINPNITNNIRNETKPDQGSLNINVGLE